MLKKNSYKIAEQLNMHVNDIFDMVMVYNPLSTPLYGVLIGQRGYSRPPFETPDFNYKFKQELFS